MTGGTTTTEVARRLVDRSGLTVVTNALNIASELALRPTVKLTSPAARRAASPTSWSARWPNRRWPT